jgi:hypothetical protein
VLEIESGTSCILGKHSTNDYIPILHSLSNKQLAEIFVTLTKLKKMSMNLTQSNVRQDFLLPADPEFWPTLEQGTTALMDPPENQLNSGKTILCSTVQTGSLLVPCLHTQFFLTLLTPFTRSLFSARPLKCFQTS